MADDDLIPRRGREPDNVRALKGMIDTLSKRLDELSKSASLRNASISGGDGLVVYDSAGNIRLRIATDDGAILAYDAAGNETARYGLLAYSDPGQYGIEAKLSNGTWSHVGAGGQSWNTLADKPATFPPTLPIPGSGVSGNVAAANWAAQADGSKWAFDNTVTGTTFYAVWVGDDGGFHFGRNTSSLRYKHNVRDFNTDLSDLLKVRPVLFDYNDKFEPPLDPVTGGPAEGPERLVPGAKDQYGFVAEELVEVWPEVITYYDHHDGKGPVIDGVRYDLIAARLVPALQDLLRLARGARDRVKTMEDKLAKAQATLADQDAKIKALDARLTKLGG